MCLGHILAEDGRKMSKHLGNIIEPIPLMDQHGADAVRWFMAASGSPWAARRVGHTALQEIVRKVLLTYWNTVAFQVLYGRTYGWKPGTPAPAVADRPVMDRWALSEAHRLAAGVTEALEDFDTQRTGTLLAAYVDDLSNWYVRRSRRRFWDGDPAALATLHECLYVVTLLLAPLTPFITERVWQDMFRPTSAEPRSRCTWRRGRGWTAPWSTTGCPPGWRWPGGSSSSAGPPAPTPRCGPGSRSRRALVADVGLDPAGRGAARRGGRGAQRRARSSRCRRRATWWTSPPRATSGRWASGSASRPRRWRPPSPRRTRRRSPPR